MLNFKGNKEYNFFKAKKPVANVGNPLRVKIQINKTSQQPGNSSKMASIYQKIKLKDSPKASRSSSEEH